jgi:hypothetical protein
MSPVSGILNPILRVSAAQPTETNDRATRRLNTLRTDFFRDMIPSFAQEAAGVVWGGKTERQGIL